MKAKIVILVPILSLLAGSLSAAPLGAAFIYQGKMAAGGAAANGIYDLRFTIYDALAGPNAVGGPITNPAVVVSNGLFATSLDFGTSVFDGNARWLEVAMRTNGGGVFTPLTPRQPLSPAPYALFAPRAGSAASATTAATASLASNVANNAVTSAGIAPGQVVKSINGLRDDLTLAAGSNASLSTLGNTFTLSTPADWHLGGNSGTDPDANFVGTLDNQPLDLRVNTQRAFRLEPTTNSPNVIGGVSINAVPPGVTGATIGGGGVVINEWGDPSPNRVEADYGTVGGGVGNTVRALKSTIGGGLANTIHPGSAWSTVSGGAYNVIETNVSVGTISGGYGNTIWHDSDRVTISGGDENQIQNGVYYGSIGGGFFNVIQATADSSTIGGGRQNTIGANAEAATIGGGYNNTIQSNAFEATIAGGYQNMIEVGAQWSTIGGGFYNRIASNSPNSTIAGGIWNLIHSNAPRATISGGEYNLVASEAATLSGGRPTKSARTPFMRVLGAVFGTMFFPARKGRGLAGASIIQLKAWRRPRLSAGGITTPCNPMGNLPSLVEGGVMLSSRTRFSRSSLAGWIMWRAGKRASRLGNGRRRCIGAALFGMIRR